MNNAVIQSIFFFILAGLLEIGGGYLMWLWLREKYAWWIGAIGAFVIILYGVVPTLQTANFGRVYAAYGGVFVVMSILWGWWIDDVKPDAWDVVGGVSYSLISSGCKMRMTDIASSHYKTTLLSTVGNLKYNKNRSESRFKNAAPILVM